MTPLTISLEQYLNEVSQLNETVASLNNEISCLKEQLEWFKKQLFGKRSEKIIGQRNEKQLYFEGFNIAPPEEEKQPISAHQRTKRNCAS